MSWRDFNNAIDAMSERDHERLHELRFSLAYHGSIFSKKGVLPTDVFRLPGDPDKGVPSGSYEKMLEIAEEMGLKGHA